MGREQPSAMAVLSQSLRPQHSLSPAFGADKVPLPGCRLSQTPGIQMSLAPSIWCWTGPPSPTQGVLQDSPRVCLSLDVKKKAIARTGREKNQ